MRGQAAAIDDLIRRLPPALAAHMAAHRDVVARATLLNVVCGRLTNWTAPGLLLIGDAAHPMSPVGGQGLNVAVRDALVAANHLCPVLVAGGDGAAIDAAARRVQDERMPEIVAIQEMQQKQSRVFFDRDRLSVRLGLWLMPLPAARRPAGEAEPPGERVHVAGRGPGALHGLTKRERGPMPLARRISLRHAFMLS